MAPDIRLGFKIDLFYSCSVSNANSLSGPIFERLIDPVNSRDLKIHKSPSLADIIDVESDGCDSLSKEGLNVCFEILTTKEGDTRKINYVVSRK